MRRRDFTTGLLTAPIAVKGKATKAEFGRSLDRTLLTDGRSFDGVAAQIRARTAGRRHTPAEILQREGRDER